MTDNDIRYISSVVSNCLYRDNMQATRELVELLDNVCKSCSLTIPDDYIKAYDDLCFTYKTFEELIESELEQGVYGFTYEECSSEIGKSIFQLPCGLWVQLV